jgi:hypothetical protein
MEYRTTNLVIKKPSSKSVRVKGEGRSKRLNTKYELSEKKAAKNTM